MEGVTEVEADTIKDTWRVNRKHANILTVLMIAKEAGYCR
jgi:hypothetical protein